MLVLKLKVIIFTGNIFLYYHQINNLVFLLLDFLKIIHTLHKKNITKISYNYFISEDEELGFKTATIKVLFCHF